MNRSTKQFAVAMAVVAIITGLKAGSLTVEGGNPSGNYAAGTLVTVSADAPQAGAQFAGWTGDVGILVNPFLPTTTAIIPNMAVKITATFIPAENSFPTLDGNWAG
jgi:hypothetical protein